MPTRAGSSSRDVLPEPVAEIVSAVMPLVARDGGRLVPPLSMVMTRGRGRGRKTGVLLCSDGRPALYLKISRSDGADDLRREDEALRLVASRGVARVPHCYGLLQVGDRHVLVQSALPGAPLSLALRSSPWPARSTELALRGTARWLLAMQRSTADGTSLLQVDDLPDRLGARLQQAGGSRSTREQSLQRLGRSAACLRSLPVPCVGSHGDLWPGNVLWSSRGAAVVDWGHYVPVADPFRDLWFLLLTGAHVLPGRAWSWRTGEDAFATAFVERGRYARLATRLVHEHLRAYGLPVQAAEALLAMFLLDRGDVDANGSVHEPVGPADLEWPRLLELLIGAQPAQPRLNGCPSARPERREVERPAPRRTARGSAGPIGSP